METLSSFLPASLPATLAEAPLLVVVPNLVVLAASLFFLLGRRPAQVAEVGVVGLGVMGSQLCLNLAEKLQAVVAGFDLADPKVAALAEAAQNEGGLLVTPTTSLKAFVGSLKRPRKILLLVPAGKPVDAVIASLKPLLSRGDLIVDMGNEWYEPVSYTHLTLPTILLV